MCSTEWERCISPALYFNVNHFLCSFFFPGTKVFQHVYKSEANNSYVLGAVFFLKYKHSVLPCFSHLERFSAEPDNPWLSWMIYVEVCLQVCLRMNWFSSKYLGIFGILNFLIVLYSGRKVCFSWLWNNVDFKDAIVWLAISSLRIFALGIYLELLIFTCQTLYFFSKVQLLAVSFKPFPSSKISS